MKYIYGPVRSRRLGFSLGVTLTLHKVCSFDCIYCQIGKTTDKTLLRKEYLDIKEVIAEVNSWLMNNPNEARELSYITFSGSGEPTLNIQIESAINQIKDITTVPVAVITNASLLNDARVRGALLQADLIVPSLDAVVPEVFNKIDRPQELVKLEEIIEGLISLRREYRGKIWLEVMLVRGINDDLRHIKKLKDIIDRIKPDKIQLNSPVRTTAEADVFAVDRKKLDKIKEILGERAEII